MSEVALKKFDTEQELTDYADQLNEAGLYPEIAVMDSAGISVLACLQAPGGDGWGFAYYGVTEGDEGTIQGDVDGGYVEPRRYLNGYPVTWPDQPGWNPVWPVFGIVTVTGDE